MARAIGFWFAFFLVCMVALPASARYLVFSAETYEDLPIYGIFTLPDGQVKKTKDLIAALKKFSIAKGSTIVFDTATDSATLYYDTLPYALVSENDFFAPYNPLYDIAVYTAVKQLYTAGPSRQDVNTPGAITYVGNFLYTQFLDFGTLVDADGDGILDAFDNCPMHTNTGQQDFDDDTMGNACDLDDDNDGVSDLDEINLYGTNELDADTDGDGFDDGFEISFGTNPLDNTEFPGSSGAVQIPFVPAWAIALLAGLLIALGSIFGTRRKAC